MPKYAVMMQGAPIMLQVEEEITRCGFYRQEILFAANEADAAAEGIKEVKRLLKEMDFDSPELEVSVTRIRRLSWLGGMFKFSSEFIYYRQKQDDSADDQSIK